MNSQRNPAHRGRDMDAEAVASRQGVPIEQAKDAVEKTRNLARMPMRWLTTRRRAMPTAGNAEMDLLDSERLALLGMRALRTTEGGDEAFVGLSGDESVEFLPLNRKYEDCSGLSRNEQDRFLELRAKHEAARQAIMQGQVRAS